MHMIYLGIAIHVAAGIYVYGISDDYLLDIILHQYKTTLYMNYAHFELILILSIK